MKTLRFASTVAILFTLFSLLPMAGTARAQQVAYQEDFEDGQAQGWTLEPGWQVDQVDGNTLLAGEGHTWARHAQSFNGDMRLSFRVKLLQGRIHMVVRLTDLSRYFIRFDAEGSALSKQYFPDEFQENMAAGGTTHSLDRWYLVEIVLEGSRIDFLVDGTQEWSYTDPQGLQNGGLAFETLELSQAYVDDILVETGAGTAATATRPVATATLQAATATRPSPASLTWNRLGGPIGGLGYDVRMRPDDLDVMFVTDANAGVFESLDGGVNWFPSSEGITVRTGATGDAIPIFCLTIDPNDNDIVWTGTQSTRGIFKSVDGGNTWTRMDRGIIEQDGITFRGFTVQPGNSDVVYAASEISSWNWAGWNRQGREFEMVAGAVYKTTDGGLHWKLVWRGDSLARYIWIDPRDTDVLYISTGIFDREAANSDPVQGIAGGEGLLKSTDGGLTWVNINNGIHNLYVGSLFMHPTDPDILLAGAGSNQYNDGAGVYLTINGGETWQQTLSDVMQITSVEISTSDPDIAYAASRFVVYRSTNGGRNWVPVTSGTTWGAPGAQTGFPIDLQVDPRDPDRLFANAYGGGVFMSEDGGRTWVEASKGYTGAQVRVVVVDPTAPARVIAAARSGVFASSDGGSNWHGINSPGIDSIEWNALAINPANPQIMLGGMNVGGGELILTSNGGKTWKPVVTLETFGMGWRAIAFAPSDPDVIYAGTAGYFSAGSFDNTRPAMGIYFSTNGGLTWQRTPDVLVQDAHVSALAVDPSDPRTVFATTLNHGLLKSTDGGHSWSEIPGNWTNNYYLLAVSINPDDPATILLGATHAGVYKSTDGGTTWKHPVAGLAAEATVTSIVFDPVNPSQVLYLADRISGVYRSTDGGQTWQVINTGLANRAIQNLAISSDGLHLYAASDGGGVFRLDLNGQPPEAVLEPTPVPTAIPATQPSQNVSPTAAAEPSTHLPSFGGFPLSIILVIAGVFIVAVVLFLFLALVLRRRRK